MSIRVPHNVKPSSSTETDRKAAAFIAGSGKASAPADASKTVVNLRFDSALLAKIDAAAKRQGVTRTAWLHRAAFDALGE